MTLISPPEITQRLNGVRGRVAAVARQTAGQPFGAGFAPNLIITFLIAHGLWGLGTAVFLGVLTGWRNQPS